MSCDEECNGSIPLMEGGACMLWLVRVALALYSVDLFGLNAGNEVLCSLALPLVSGGCGDLRNPGKNVSNPIIAEQWPTLYKYRRTEFSICQNFENTADKNLQVTLN